jgi:hypothetical protein
MGTGYAVLEHLRGDEEDPVGVVVLGLALLAAVPQAPLPRGVRSRRACRRTERRGWNIRRRNRWSVARTSSAGAGLRRSTYSTTERICERTDAGPRVRGVGEDVAGTRARTGGFIR